MAVICTRPPTVRFVQIRNEWARDRRLGYKARGLLTYLHSHEDGYVLSNAQIVRDSTDGKDAVKTGLDELEATGYLRRVRIERGDGGRWAETDYRLSDPFDADGRIIRPPDAEDERITRRSGLSGADYPARITRPLEDNGENTKTPTESPSATTSQLRLVDEEPTAPPPDPFDTFWATYPKRVGKDAARRAWNKATRRADPVTILDVLSRYPFRSDRQYVKDPATWLNAGCWLDDLAAVAAAVRRGNEPRNVTGGGYGPGYRDPADPAAFTGRF